MSLGTLRSSRVHLPAALGSTVVTRFVATMAALTPAPLPSSTGAGLFAYPLMPSDPSHSNHPPVTSSPRLAWGLRAGRGPDGPDFARSTPARLTDWPNRVHLHWHDGLGRVVPRRRLPTPPCGDAVAFGFTGGARCARTGTFTCCHHGFTNARRAGSSGAFQAVAPALDTAPIAHNVPE